VFAIYAARQPKPDEPMNDSRFQKVNRLSESDAQTIRVQLLAAQLGIEFLISGNAVYCSTEFHYQSFQSLDDAEAYLKKESAKKKNLAALMKKIKS
jgi:hypothetical protein